VMYVKRLDDPHAAEDIALCMSEDDADALSRALAACCSAEGGRGGVARRVIATLDMLKRLPLSM